MFIFSHGGKLPKGADSLFWVATEPVKPGCENLWVDAAQDKRRVLFLRDLGCFNVPDPFCP